MKKIMLLFLLFCSPVRAEILDEQINNIRGNYQSPDNCSRAILGKVIEQSLDSNSNIKLGTTVTMIVELITFFYDFLKTEDKEISAGPKQKSIEAMLNLLNILPMSLRFENVPDETYTLIVFMFSKPLNIMYQYFIAEQRGLYANNYGSQGKSGCLKSLLIQEYKTHKNFMNAFGVLNNSFNEIKESGIKSLNENDTIYEFANEQYWLQEKTAHNENVNEYQRQELPSYEEIAAQDVYTSAKIALGVGAGMAVVTNAYDVQGKLKKITKPLEKYPKIITIGTAGAAFGLAYIILRAIH